MAVNLFKRAKTIWIKDKKRMSWKAAVKKAAAELRKSPRQTGTSNKKRDAARKSKKPGRRRSASGKIYYERRKSRTDKPGSVTGIRRKKSRINRIAGTLGSPFKNMSEVKAKNKEAGFYFFSPGTMKFFNSKIESPLLMGRYFIDSSVFVSSDGKTRNKYYTVRWVENNGNIRTLEIGGTTKFKDKQAARKAVSEHWFKK